MREKLGKKHKRANYFSCGTEIISAVYRTPGKSTNCNSICSTIKHTIILLQSIPSYTYACIKSAASLKLQCSAISVFTKPQNLLEAEGDVATQEPIPSCMQYPIPRIPLCKHTVLKLWSLWTLFLQFVIFRLTNLDCIMMCFIHHDLLWPYIWMLFFRKHKHCSPWRKMTLFKHSNLLLPINSIREESILDD